MADNEFVIGLGKVLIAAAWADGELADDEVNCNPEQQQDPTEQGGV